MAGDPAYDEEVLPLALSLLDPEPNKTYLDVGCGEGRVMAAIAETGASAIGVDISPALLERAARFGETHLDDVPPISFAADDSVDGVAIVLVLEHIPDEEAVFAETARITRSGGTMALIINHPMWTAPESTPILEDDGEILWRPGRYFGVGFSEEAAGEGTVRFHHRTMSRLLGSAADAGWQLDRMVEQGVSPAQVERTPLLAGQEHIPRLLGVRWILG